MYKSLYTPELAVKELGMLLLEKENQHLIKDYHGLKQKAKKKYASKADQYEHLMVMLMYQMELPRTPANHYENLYDDLPYSDENLEHLDKVVSYLRLEKSWQQVVKQNRAQVWKQMTGQEFFKPEDFPNSVITNHDIDGLKPYWKHGLEIVSIQLLGQKKESGRFYDSPAAQRRSFPHVVTGIGMITSPGIPNRVMEYPREITIKQMVRSVQLAKYLFFHDQYWDGGEVSIAYQMEMELPELKVIVPNMYVDSSLEQVITDVREKLAPFIQEHCDTALRKGSD